jgi:hypothetical protein
MVAASSARNKSNGPWMIPANCVEKTDWTKELPRRKKEHIEVDITLEWKGVMARLGITQYRAGRLLQWDRQADSRR